MQRRASASATSSRRKKRNRAPVIDLTNNTSVGCIDLTRDNEVIEILDDEVKETCEICFNEFEIRARSTYYHSRSEGQYGSALFCGHMYCSSCINSWVKNAVEERKFPLICPREGCAVAVRPEHLHGIIEDKAIFTDFSGQFIEQELSSQGMYCPNKECSQLLLQDNDNPVSYAECPLCKSKLCMKCRVSWHANYTCAEFQEIPETERQVEDLQLLDLAKQSAWGKCPKCNFIVEKTQGCNHISCRCGTSFCYRCGKEYLNNIATARNNHGQPACKCALFGQATPAVPVRAPPQPKRHVAKGKRRAKVARR